MNKPINNLQPHLVNSTFVTFYIGTLVSRGLRWGKGGASPWQIQPLVLFEILIFSMKFNNMKGLSQPIARI